MLAGGAELRRAEEVKQPPLPQDIVATCTVDTDACAELQPSLQQAGLLQLA